MKPQILNKYQTLASLKQEDQLYEPYFETEFQNLMKIIQSTDWRKNLKKYVNFYNLKIYKLEIMSPKSIRTLYYKLKQKYLKISNEHDRIYWFQNELKIFVWLLVVSDQTFGIALDCYTDKQIQLLSRPFFRINEDLCQYQFKLLTCLEFDQNWDIQENFMLSDLVKKYNFNCSWTTISKELFLESGKKYLRTAHSCREKWQNHLDTRLVKGNWTIEDDYVIIKNRVALGKKWSQIAKVFGPTRTEHMIKNRFKVILKRQSNKKEVRSIEQFDVCQQIQRKLLDKLAATMSTTVDSSTTVNSPSVFQSYSLKDVVVKMQQNCFAYPGKQESQNSIFHSLQPITSVPYSKIKPIKQEESSWNLELLNVQKLSNSLPMLVDEQYLNFLTDINLMDEPKPQFLF